MIKCIHQKYDNIVNIICQLFSGSLVQIICFMMYKLLVDLIYGIYIGKTAGYGINISPLNIVSGYIAVFVFSWFIVNYSYTATASALIMISINMIYFIPITTYCSLGLGSSSFLFFTIVFWGWLSILQIIIPKFSIREVKTAVNGKLFYILFISMFVLTIYISFRYTGFRVITNLQEIYKIRAEAADYKMSIWLSYLQNFSSIIIPMLILMSFSKRKYCFAILNIILLLLNFSFAGHKSILFMGVLLIAGYVFWEQKMVFLIVPGGIVLEILGLLEERLSSHAYIIGYFFRRQGYLLAQLSDEYFRYFKNNPTDIFRSTFLGKLGFESPYKLTISQVIGNNFETQSVNCNNGLLADVWSHLGIIGIIIMPVILIVCFRLFDMASDGLDARYFIGLSLYYAVMFANSTWSTVLLTHGYLIMCLLFFLFERGRSDNQKR